MIAEFAHAGLLALTIPKQYGALELSATAYARVFEQISASILRWLFSSEFIAGSVEGDRFYGNEEQKARYLPLSRAGDARRYALTEPRQDRCAEHQDDCATLGRRNTLILDGHKIWIGNAHRAGVIATFAQTPLSAGCEMVMRRLRSSSARHARLQSPGNGSEARDRGSTQLTRYKNLECRPISARHCRKGIHCSGARAQCGKTHLAAGCTQAQRRS